MTMLDQKSARIRFRLGFACYEVRRKTYLEASDVLLGSKRYSPAGSGHLEAKMGSELANLRLGKRPLWTSQEPEIAEDKTRSVSAGYAVRSRACLDASVVLFCAPSATRQLVLDVWRPKWAQNWPT